MVRSMSRFHPWRHARDHHAGTRITHERDLHVAGDTDGQHIRLHAGMTQAQRRCVLTHEIVHIERGTAHGDERWVAREERIVDEIAARRLILIEDLIDALVWTRGNPDRECAWELWTDLHTLTVRVQNLSADERRHIDTELARRQL